MSDMLNRLYLPDGANLNVMGWGQAGSGKTVFFQTTLDKFLKKNKNYHILGYTTAKVTRVNV